MKTLHIISRLETGGAQKLLSELLPNLADCGIRSDILVFCRLHNHIEKTLTDSGINIISLDIKNLKSPALIPAIRRIIRRYDLVHVHLFPALYECAIAAIGTDIPLIYTEHSTSNRRREKTIFRPLEKLIYKRYSKIIAISSQVADSLKQWIGTSIGKKIVTIENGIDIHRIKSATSFSPRKNSRILLMVSRFNNSKDQKTVIRAIPFLKEKDMVVVFAGDGPEIDDCKKLVADLNVSDRVVFLGNRTDIPHLAKGCYIGIQSSNWEGFGLTAVEIMAAGKPMIASDVNGLRQVVENAGLLFKKGNPEDLAKCINTLAADKDLYEKTAYACGKRAQSFSIERTAKRYADLYSQVLNKSLISK